MSFLQMSLHGAVMIAVITILRALTLNQVPKKTFLVLWALALVRLLVPFSLPSRLSVYTLLARQAPAVSDATAVSPPPVLPAAPVTVMPQVTAPSASTVSPWAVVWLVGIEVCALTFAVLYVRCYREFQTSLPVEHDYARRWLAAHPLRRKLVIRQSDRVSSPLTFGVLRPVILMPKSTDWSDEGTLRFVLEHEFVHVQRFDALSKLALIAAVCVHWFDPLVWVMYVLANRDLELSCDETVVHRFGGARADYARTLIRMMETRSGVAPLCNGFSKNAIEERITAIMKTKKATIISFVLAAVLITGTAPPLRPPPKRRQTTATEQPPPMAQISSRTRSSSPQGSRIRTPPGSIRARPLPACTTTKAAPIPTTPRQATSTSPSSAAATARSPSSLRSLKSSLLSSSTVT